VADRQEVVSSAVQAIVEGMAQTIRAAIAIAAIRPAMQERLGSRGIMDEQHLLSKPVLV
jgi:hypothetical protein